MSSQTSMIDDTRDREIERRLAVLETLLRSAVESLAKLEKSHYKSVSEFQKIKNKGAGILIGISLFAGFIGAKATAIMTWLAN